jgi:hypothetical protein
VGGLVGQAVADLDALFDQGERLLAPCTRRIAGEIADVQASLAFPSSKPGKLRSILPASGNRSGACGHPSGPAIRCRCDRHAPKLPEDARLMNCYLADCSGGRKKTRTLDQLTRVIETLHESSGDDAS